MTAELPRWFTRVRALYERLDREIEPDRDLCALRGVCCDFRHADHVLYAGALEARYAELSRRLRGATTVPASDPRLCPYWRNGLCTARLERPLGCRTYFCAPEWRERGERLYERYHAELNRIATEEGIEVDYRPWVEHVS